MDPCPTCHRPFMIVPVEWDLSKWPHHVPCLGCGIPTAPSVLPDGYCETCLERLRGDGHMYHRKGFIRASRRVYDHSSTDRTTSSPV